MVKFYIERINMLTKEEFFALMQLINRIALTQAEALWLNSIMNKLQPQEPKKE